MPYKEIAQTLGVSVNTVEKHMVKALASLRAALKNR
jgi:DNA-directed RNA polymerase specialized sigma24 family protein